MLNTRMEQAGGSGSLVIEGEMIIDHAEELKRTFQTALENQGSLNINVERVNKVDLFGLQVLCSAHHAALKAGNGLVLIGERPEALRDAVVMAGFGRTVACSVNSICPWNKE